MEIHVATLRSKAKILDHALHPMLVTIPLGALPTMLVFDALYWWNPTDTWALAALVANVVGVVGIALAAIPGSIDYYTVVPDEGHAHRTATKHYVLGVALLVLFAALAAWRWLALPQPEGGTWWGILAVSVIGNLGLGLQGYWGGSLVEHHHIGTYAEDEERPQGKRRGTVGGGRE